MTSLWGNFRWPYAIASDYFDFCDNCSTISIDIECIKFHFVDEIPGSYFNVCWYPMESFPEEHGVRATLLKYGTLYRVRTPTTSDSRMSVQRVSPSTTTIHQADFVK